MPPTPPSTVTFFFDLSETGRKLLSERAAKMAPAPAHTTTSPRRGGAPSQSGGGAAANKSKRPTKAVDLKAKEGPRGSDSRPDATANLSVCVPATADRGSAPASAQPASSSQASRSPKEYTGTAQVAQAGGAAAASGPKGGPTSSGRGGGRGGGAWRKLAMLEKKRTVQLAQTLGSVGSAAQAEAERVAAEDRQRAEAEATAEAELRRKQQQQQQQQQRRPFDPSPLRSRPFAVGGGLGGGLGVFGGRATLDGSNSGLAQLASAPSADSEISISGLDDSLFHNATATRYVTVAPRSNPHRAVPAVLQTPNDPCAHGTGRWGMCHGTPAMRRRMPSVRAPTALARVRSWAPSSASCCSRPTRDSSWVRELPGRFTPLFTPLSTLSPHPLFAFSPHASSRPLSPRPSLPRRFPPTRALLRASFLHRPPSSASPAFRTFSHLLTPSSHTFFSRPHVASHISRTSPSHLLTRVSRLPPQPPRPTASGSPLQPAGAPSPAPRVRSTA